MTSLAGKVAIVTGASRGIGKAIVEAYAAEGARVAVTSRSLSSVEPIVAEIKANGGEAVAIACDVGEPAQIAAMVDATVAAFGGVDILVNNAQSFGTREQPSASNWATALEDVTDAEWDWLFDSGVKATLKAMQAAFPHMKARGGGSIINFGSRRGILAPPTSVAYNANKEAVRGLSRTATNEWGRFGIRCNVINPVIETDAARGEFAKAPGSREKTERAIPLRRWGQPEDCARIAVFLASDASSYLSGMTFMVDGGLTTLP
jgi:NAD(P)-dependent dehydrogenase (short-subunit alcohol dehydrogenase family)